MQNVEQDRGDAGKEVCRTGGMKERRMKDRRDLGHKGYRKGEIQERRKAGRGMQDRRDARSHVRKVGYRFFVNCLFCRLYCTAGNQMYSKKRAGLSGQLDIRCILSSLTSSPTLELGLTFRCWFDDEVCAQLTLSPWPGPTGCVHVAA